MKELTLDLLKQSQEELERLQYEKALCIEAERHNTKLEKAYRIAVENGLTVEPPFLAKTGIIEIEEDIKLAKAVITRLETVIKMFSLAE